MIIITLFFIFISGFEMLVVDITTVRLFPLLLTRLRFQIFTHYFATINPDCIKNTRFLLISQRILHTKIVVPNKITLFLLFVSWYKAWLTLCTVVGICVYVMCSVKFQNLYCINTELVLPYGHRPMSMKVHLSQTPRTLFE